MSINNQLIKTDFSKVDSHQHFWQLSRGDYGWLTHELTGIYKDFLPEHLAPELTTKGFSQTILIQAADTEEETLFLLEIANNTKFVAGVVGWVDLADPLAIAKLQNLAQDSYFKGIRPMLQDIDDVHWILQDEFTPVFQFMAEKKLTFDALIKDTHLSNIHILAERHPTLNIVINHCAKPDLSREPSEFWQQKLTDISSCKNIYIKLSGLLTEAPTGQVSIERIQPYFDHIMDVFGSDRIMWGSDWPVIKLNGDFKTWVSLTQSLLKHHSFEDKRKIWADNARIFYRLPIYN
ncbi:MAG: amidohydrolase family protein [Colwellia sp.]